MKLDLGCGGNKEKGFVGVDVKAGDSVDIIHDFDDYPYPFKDSSVEYIKASGIIEHLDDRRMFLRECWRMLQPRGILYVKVPHYSGRSAYAHPEHKTFYSLDFPDFLTENSAWLTDWFNRGFSETIWFKKIYSTLHYTESNYAEDNKKGARLLDRVIDYFIRLNPRIAERVWCYWVGGLCELEFMLEKEC